MKKFAAILNRAMSRATLSVPTDRQRADARLPPRIERRHWRDFI